MVDMTDNSRTTLSRPMSVETRRRVPDDTATTGPAKPKPTGAAPIRGEPTSTPIAKAQQAIIDALHQFEEDWADISRAEHGGTVTASGRAELVADAARPASDTIDAAVGQAESRDQHADQNYQQARNGLSPRSGDVAAMLRTEAIWRRASQELGALPPERLISAAQRRIDGLRPRAERAGRRVAKLLEKSQCADGLARQRTGSGVSDAENRSRPAQAGDSGVRHHQLQRQSSEARNAVGHAGSYRRPRSVEVSRFDPDAQQG